MCCFSSLDIKQSIMETVKIAAARLGQYVDIEPLNKIIEKGDISLKSQQAIRDLVYRLTAGLQEKTRNLFRLEFDTAMRIDFFAETHNMPTTKSVIHKNKQMNKTKFFYELMAKYPERHAGLKLAVDNINNPRVFPKMLTLLARSIPEIKINGAQLVKNSEPLDRNVILDVHRGILQNIPRMMTPEEFRKWVSEFPFINDGVRALIEDTEGTEGLREIAADLEALTIGFLEFFEIKFSYNDHYDFVTINVNSDVSY